MAVNIPFDIKPVPIPLPLLPPGTVCPGARRCLLLVEPACHFWRQSETLPCRSLQHYLGRRKLACQLACRLSDLPVCLAALLTACAAGRPVVMPSGACLEETAYTIRSSPCIMSLAGYRAAAVRRNTASRVIRGLQLGKVPLLLLHLSRRTITQ